MSRSYKRHYTRSRGRNDELATLVLLILIGGIIWSHRAMLPTIERWAIAVFIILVTLLIYKTVRKTRLWHQKRIIDVSGVDKMSGLEFERYVAQLLKNRGYTNIKLTEHYDFGIDIVADKDGFRWGIQVKRYSGLVKASAVRQVVTALKKYNCNKAMVITNSNYSHVANELASSNGCVLINRDILSNWIVAAHK